ncbi:MAG TPA: hypothetical protein VFE47_17340 [Tepidisphaeraceae bacterium]|nr:hypothetical protein [Tepidisphaeraceae bacterium]
MTNAQRPSRQLEFLPADSYSPSTVMMYFRTLLLASLALFGLTGCMLQKVDPNAKPATSIDPKFASSEYWFNQPATEEVRWPNYDRLWDSCEATATDAGFSIDRFDYRTGLLSTKPLVSKQFFELWKHDVVDFKSQADSDTTTHRRTAHFKISKLPDGCYLCQIKVVVEHYAMSERRITAVYQYRDAFSTRRPYEDQTADDGTPLKVDYWYAERRDHAVEHMLAERLRQYLSGKLTQIRFVTDTDDPK